MAEKKPENKGTSFTRVTKSYNPAGGSLRDTAKITAKRTGAMRSNTEAKEMLTEFVKEAGLDPNSFQLTFGGNEAAGQMALYTPRPGDTGLMKANIGRNFITFHAGACFLQFPKLRPVTTVDCYVERSVDAEGVPCIIVQLHGAAPTRTVKRAKKDESSDSK